MPVLHQLHNPYLERLAAAGVEPAAVDYVLITHLHSDHVGWNTRQVDGRFRLFPMPGMCFQNLNSTMARSDEDGTRCIGTGKS